MNTKNYTNATIGDLIILISESGWALNLNKGFYYEFEKGDRYLILTKEDDDFSLICRDREATKNYSLVLPRILSIKAAVFYAVLQCYGVVSMLTLALSEGLIQKEGHTA